MNDIVERLSRELAETLHSTLADAIASAQRERIGEKFYAYILYTLPLFDYASLLFNTEEGLARMAGDHTRQREVRWSPSEWECCPGAEEMFERENALLGSLSQL